MEATKSVTNGWSVYNGNNRELDAYLTNYGTMLEKNKLYTPINYAELKSYGTSMGAPLKRPRSEIEAECNLQNKSTAEAALEYYNKKHHTKFQLVDAVNSSGNVWASRIWLHCNFTAKHETSSDGDSSTKLFFAEMKTAGSKSGKMYLVTACRPLDGTKTTKQCEMCGNDIVHPTHGYRQGRHKHKIRTLRPRKNEKVFPNYCI